LRENGSAAIEVRTDNSVGAGVMELDHAVAAPPPTRSCKKLIRFTQAELAQVNARALAARQPVACYIRDAALGARRRVTLSAPVAAAIVHHLSRVATRLCTLRDEAEANGLPGAADFHEAVAELLNVIQELD
jgi:hypothetical protein